MKKRDVLDQPEKKPVVFTVGDRVKWTSAVFNPDLKVGVVYEWLGKVNAIDGKWVLVIGDLRSRKAGTKKWYRNPGQVRRNRNVVRLLD